jgi:DNA-binding CsgD family transcriptional regulator
VGVSRQAPGKVRTAQLEADCLRLRLDGFSHREIAAQLGVAPSTAYKRLHQALKAINEQNAAEAGTLRDLESLRLDELQNAVWQQALDGDDKAIGKVLAIMERRARLLGLDAPVRRETKAAVQDPQAARYRRQLLVQQILTEIRIDEVDGSSS